MRSTLTVISIGLVSLSAVPAAAATKASPEADRLYKLASKLLDEGRIDQGLERLDELARAYPASPLADNALLAAGRQFYGVADVDLVGQADSKNLKAAAERFEAIRRKYPTSDSAAEAHFALGLIAMEPGNPARSLDDAYGHFRTVTALHSGANVSGPAAFAAARCNLMQDRSDQALVDLLRLVEAHPGSILERRARFLLSGLFEKRGATNRALEELRLLDEPRAVDRATLVYRTRLLARSKVRSALQPWAHDRDYGVATEALGLKSVRDLAVVQDGNLWIADEKGGALVSADSAGALAGREPWNRPVAVSSSPSGTAGSAGSTGSAGTLEVASADAIGRPGRPPRGITLKPASDRPSANPEQVRRISAVASGAGGATYVLDGGESRLLRLDETGAKGGTARVVFTPERGTLAGLAAGPAGEVYVGLRPSRVVVRLDASGAETARVSGPGEGFLHIQDLAVDEIGNLYVLDDRGAAVHVFDPDGRVLGRIDLSIEEGMPKAPSALAVDAAGRVYVGDQRADRVVRFR